MNVADLAGLVALLVKAVDTARYATAKQVNGVLTQLVAWGLGVGGVFAVAQTQWAAHISIGNGSTLAHQGAFSLVAIGLSVASSGSVLKDIQAALDNSNTAALPPLVRTAIGRASGVLGNAAGTEVSGLGVPSGLVEKIRSVIAEEVGKVGPTLATYARVAAAATSQEISKLEHGVSSGAGPAVTVSEMPAPPPADAEPATPHPDFAPPPDMPLPPPVA